jgi:anti-sigma factor RsiW
MPNCTSIDPLVTPYVDEQLVDPDRGLVEQHLRVCPPCQARVAAERAVRDLIRTRRDAFAAPCASGALRARCAASAAQAGTRGETRAPRSSTWRSRMAPFALAASLVLLVGGAFVYQLTASSSDVLAAELAADHVKCFALNALMRTHDNAAAVESSMVSSFGWHVPLPRAPSMSDLELIGARACLYGEGKVAHVMYRLHGEPVSLFMLPKGAWADQVVQVLGHRAAIWCAGDRTFVLVARRPADEVEQIATAMQAAIR